jgi:hypothetical protein
MKKIVALCFSLLPLIAVAQGSKPVDSIWFPFPPSFTATATVQGLDGSGVPIGTAQQLAFTIFQTPITVSLPGPGAFAGVRVVITAAGTGWSGAETFTAPITPTTIPAGGSLTVTYEAPVTGTGTLTWAVVLPPPQIFTADCTKMPPALVLVDAVGARWTLLPLVGGVPGQVGGARNGVRAFNSVEFATIKGGVVYLSDFLSGTGWDVWNGTSFVSTRVAPC